MSDTQRVKHRIREIAQSRRNVTLEDIEWVVGQLRTRHSVGSRDTKSGHGRIFRVDNRIFHVCVHHKGSKQIKACYVDEFIDAMTDLGWYEESTDE